MPAVQEERAPDPAGVQQLLQPLVLGVVPPHEPHLHQAPSQPLFGLHDAQGPRRVRRQRLLAQHRQLPLQGVQDRLLVRGPRGGDQHGLNAGRRYRRRRVGVRGRAVQGARDLLDPVSVRIGHGHHPGAADGPPDPAHVVRTHLPGADDGDAERAGHVVFPPGSQRAPQERR